MKTLLATLFASTLLLSGCFDSGGGDACTQHDTTELYTDRYGLTVQPATQMYASPEQITAYYESTMACMGLTADGPNVVYQSFSENYLGGAWGVYTGGWVLINTDETVAPRDCETDRQVLQHEFIHHILTANGLHEENRGHASPLFAQCGLGVRVTN